MSLAAAREPQNPSPGKRSPGYSQDVGDEPNRVLLSSVRQIAEAQERGAEAYVAYVAQAERRALGEVACDRRQDYGTRTMAKKALLPRRENWRT